MTPSQVKRKQPPETFDANAPPPAVLSWQVDTRPPPLPQEAPWDVQMIHGALAEMRKARPFAATRQVMAPDELETYDKAVAGLESLLDTLWAKPS